LQEKKVVFYGFFLDSTYDVSLTSLQDAYRCHLNSVAKIARKTSAMKKYMKINFNQYRKLTFNQYGKQ
jgi:hypothetical protein